MADAPAFYAPLSEKLSQGDIVERAPWGLPWGLIDDPVTICRPEDNSKDKGKSFYSPIEKMTKPQREFEVVHSRAQFGRAVVLWEDCQIDKFGEQRKPVERWFAGIAPLLPVTKAGDGAQAIQEGKRRAFFPVPAYPAIGIKEESYVDLRYIWPIKQSLLQSRIGTLSPAARDALHVHLFAFLTRRRPVAALTCSKCGATAALDMFAPRSSEIE